MSMIGKIEYECTTDKIESYIEFLKTNPDFDTEFVDVGDGLSVSRRKNENQ